MPSKEQDLLSPAQYDADASSIQSDSEEDTLLDDSRATLDLNEHDRSILKDEEETERLLTKSKPKPFEAVQNLFRSNPHDGRPVNISKKEARRKDRKRRRSERRRRRSQDSASEGELMYEMEEGFKDTSSQASSSSMELDMKWEGKHKTKPRGSRFRKMFGYHIIVVALLSLIGYGAYRASTKYRKVQTAFTLSNGTHLFAPTTLFISLDGFRADFLNRGLTPTLNALIAEGVSPRYMVPSFPSVTFPNHFTLMTGLYPESHGVVGNSFWDPVLAEEFYYTHPRQSMQSKWWNAEPLWATAEQQGVRTAIHMWPGSEAHIPPIEPSYVDKYNGTESLPRKVNRILDLLDLPGDADSAVGGNLRPQMIAAYVPNVDADGHRFGPNSTEIRATISQVDSMIADLLQGLMRRNLTSIVNLVIVSDHGMATTSNDRLVQLDDMIDLNLVDHIDGWPLRGLRLKNPDRDLQPMYEQLLAAATKSEGFEVYTRETMPKRYHFSNNDRIAPLWVIPKAGWAIVERTDFDIAEAKAKGIIYKPKGIHGYDHEHPLMRAIAIMRGPSFPHTPNSRLEVFQNVEIYNIVCDSLGIVPNPNNGTLRLPLKPVGIHDQDVPNADDPPPTESGVKEVWGLPTDADVPASVTTTTAVADTATSAMATTPTPESATPVQSQKTSAEATKSPEPAPVADEPTPPKDGDDQKSGGWFDYFKDRLDAAKEWASGVLDSLKNSGWKDPEPDESGSG